MEETTETSENGKETSKEVTTITQSELAATSFEKFKSLDEMLAFGKVICKSRLSPLKTEQDVVAALLMGKELGMGVMVSINNIYPIEGKASSGIHLIAGQLLKAGIAYEVLHDYEPVFNIALKSKDDEEKEILIPVGKRAYSIPLREGEQRSASVKDYLTSIKFKRKLKQPDGTYIDMEIVSNYYHSDIPKEFLEKKANWKNHLKEMMYTRCFTNGAKRIGDDVILGLYETSELADAHNIPVEVVDGVATIVHDNNPKEQKQKDTSGMEEANILENKE